MWLDKVNKGEPNVKMVYEWIQTISMLCETISVLLSNYTKQSKALSSRGYKIAHILFYYILMPSLMGVLTADGYGFVYT